MSTPLNLVADIGGTNARFALYNATTQKLSQAQTLPTANFEHIEQAIAAYLSDTKAKIEHAAIAIANPVTGDDIRMTNHHWQFSISALQHTFGFKSLHVINDFIAQAWAVLRLAEHEQRVIAARPSVEDAPIAVIGPGTGLGVSILSPHQGQWHAIATEGGHVNIAPRTDLEIDLLRYAQSKLGEHVSAERFLSGAGMALIDEAMVHINGYSRQARSAQEITTALLQNDRCAQETMDIFSQLLATVSANLILTAGARGGLYICGGILPRIEDYFVRQSPFYRRLINKGRFSDYIRQVPVYLVTAQEPGLRGVAQALTQFKQQQ